MRQRWTDRFHPLIGGVYAKGAAHLVDSLASSRGASHALLMLCATMIRRRRERTRLPTFDPAVIPFDFDLQNPTVQQAVRDRAARLAELVGDTTAEQISEAIEFGLQEGLSIAEIAKLVDQVAFGGHDMVRATLIARTETIGALSAGEFDTATATGIIAGKEWLTQGDDRVRDTHYACEAEGMIALDDRYATNGMLYPGDPAGGASEVCNCRCGQLYYDTLEPGKSSIAGAGTPMRLSDLPTYMIRGVEYALLPLPKPVAAIPAITNGTH